MRPVLLTCGAATVVICVAGAFALARPGTAPAAPAAQVAPTVTAARPAVQTQPPPIDGRTGMPLGPVDTAGCVTSLCHPNVKDHAQLHGPVSVNACDACHEVVDEKTHTFVLPRQGTTLCTFCHDMNLGEEAIVHEPLRTGECIACHSPHGGPQRTLLKAASASSLCAECHVDVVGENRHVHGPVAAGACAACHSPHSSRFPNLLPAEGSALCIECHVTVATQLATLRNVHAPVAEDCQLCHDGHASNQPMMLTDEPQALCLSCHEAIKHTLETAKTQHAAVTTDRECLNCHSPHASDFPRMLDSDMRTLCFECHDREIKLDGDKKLMNIKKIISSGNSVHGPIAQDNCAACHQIHGGDNFRLLMKEYPPEFYAPFREESYALCFSCHNAELVRDQQTTTLTDFRNGDQNLHFLHVNRDRKGRTCRACHETHASQSEKHVRESVPFGSGGWELPINFVKRQTGGSCAPGCHKPFEYDRETPSVNEPLDVPAIWPNDRTPAEDPRRLSMNTLERLIGLALATLIVVAATAQADSLRNIQPGQTVPAFTLNTMAGKTLNSADLRGKVVVLVFLSAQQRSSERAAADAHSIVRSLKRDDLALLFVTADVSQTAYFRDYRDSTNTHEPLVLDFDRKLYGSLGLIVQPTTVVIDREGKLAHVISSFKSDYRTVLDAYCRHAVGDMDDEGLRKALESTKFERSRPADRIARHRAAAGLLRRNGLLPDTEKELRAALEIDPEHVETRLDLASLFIVAERADEARVIVESVLAEKPLHRRAKLLHGIVLYHAGDLDGAEKVLAKVLLLNPDPELTHYYLGLIADKRGDEAKAVEHFKEALSRLLADRTM